MSAQIAPAEENFDLEGEFEEVPYTLPTGNELMTSPIMEGGVTRFDQEIAFVINSVKQRLDAIHFDEEYQRKKWVLFSVGGLIGLGGATVVCYAFGLTPLFQHREDIDWVAVPFAGLLFIPILWWFYYLCFPDVTERISRRNIHQQREERRSKGYFNTLVKDAGKATEPPPRVVKVFAHIRKHDYPVKGVTWRDFCETVHFHVGLKIERQLLRFKDEDLVIDLSKKIYDEAYGVDNGDRVYVYNRGGFFTVGDPIVAQYNAMLQHDADLAKPKVEEVPKTLFDIARSTVSFVAPSRSKSKSGRSSSKGQSRGDDSARGSQSGGSGAGSGDVGVTKKSQNVSFSGAKA